MSDELAALFERVGLTAQKAKETAANKKLSATFEQVIKAVSLTLSNMAY